MENIIHKLTLINLSQFLEVSLSSSVHWECLNRKLSWERDSKTNILTAFSMNAVIEGRSLKGCVAISARGFQGREQMLPNFHLP